jgi:hypothetical protein
VCVLYLIRFHWDTSVLQVFWSAFWDLRVPHVNALNSVPTFVLPSMTLAPKNVSIAFTLVFFLVKDGLMLDLHSVNVFLSVDSRKHYSSVALLIFCMQKCCNYEIKDLFHNQINILGLGIYVQPGILGGNYFSQQTLSQRLNRRSVFC